MKNIILTCLIFGLAGCTINKQYIYTQSPLSQLSKEELSLLVAIEFIQYDNKDCTVDCNKKVSCTFEYFGSKYYYSIGLDYNEKKVLPPNVYYIKRFGKIVFERKTDELDYYFSPVLVDEKSRIITLQVKTGNNKKYIITFNILNNELYVASAFNYPIDNCEW